MRYAAIGLLLLACLSCQSQPPEPITKEIYWRSGDVYAKLRITYVGDNLVSCTQLPTNLAVPISDYDLSDEETKHLLDERRFRKVFACEMYTIKWNYEHGRGKYGA